MGKLLRILSFTTWSSKQTGLSEVPWELELLLNLVRCADHASAVPEAHWSALTWLPPLSQLMTPIETLLLCPLDEHCTFTVQCAAVHRGGETCRGTVGPWCGQYNRSVHSKITVSWIYGILVQTISGIRGWIWLTVGIHWRFNAAPTQQDRFGFMTSFWHNNCKHQLRLSLQHYQISSLEI